MNLRIKLIIIFIFLFSSCITEKQRAKICVTCPTHIENIKHTEIIIDTRDTTIYVKGDTAFIKGDSIPCLESINYSKVVKSGKATIKIDIVDNILDATATCDSLEIIVEKYREYITKLEFKSEVKQIEVYKTPLWKDVLLVITSIISLWAVGIFLIKRYL
jgi:hypothetical protein